MLKDSNMKNLFKKIYFGLGVYTVGMVIGACTSEELPKPSKKCSCPAVRVAAFESKVETRIYPRNSPFYRSVENVQSGDIFDERPELKVSEIEIIKGPVNLVSIRYQVGTIPESFTAEFSVETVRVNDFK